MKDTIRCVISCILPCGALDVIRVVHCNGRVEEISGSVLASDIMKAHPKHVLKKPSSSPSDHGGVVPQIVIVPPDAELQRGKIYFLMPVPSSEKAKTKTKAKKRKVIIKNESSNSVVMNNLLISDDQYLSDILTEKVSTQRDRRRGRVGVWRPHLESICESPSDIDVHQSSY